MRYPESPDLGGLGLNGLCGVLSTIGVISESAV